MVSLKEAEVQQAALTPKEDLRPYVGQWVALRDGIVVAHDIDPVSLREQPGVHPTDVILPVPDAEGGYFL